MTWHMLQEERLNMITGCSVINRRIRASDDSSTSMDKEEEEVGEGGSSEDTTSFAHRFIAGELGETAERDIAEGELLNLRRGKGLVRSL